MGIINLDCAVSLCGPMLGHKLFCHPFVTGKAQGTQVVQPTLSTPSSYLVHVVSVPKGIAISPRHQLNTQGLEVVRGSLVLQGCFQLGHYVLKAVEEPNAIQATELTDATIPFQNLLSSVGRVRANLEFVYTASRAKGPRCFAVALHILTAIPTEPLDVAGRLLLSSCGSISAHKAV